MPEHNPYPLLSLINSPRDLRARSESELPQLAAELRQFTIETVSRTGGHLAAGLGTVELTIALHYVFDTPEDRLVWDVGHQTYPHKILTGRRERMHTLRQKGGLSGFPRRAESEFDVFGVGHSSTSVSAALGMAVAAARSRSPRHVIAVIGDGALSAGIAFEALNNAGNMDANLLVILNDNDMSISPNVGAVSNYLARILSGKVYTSVRSGSKTVLSTVRPVRELAKRVEEHFKGMLMPGTLFEELGFNYIGPIDGHDLATLVKTLRNMRDLPGPRFLHVVTRKGKGYQPAEGDPCVYHGVTPFDPATGKMEQKTGGRTYTQVFGEWLCHTAAADRRLIAITPAMREGSGLVSFSERFPDRYFDVGIAEQHAVTFAAGLACEGLKPVVAIYSTFLQRAYDQVVHDVSLQHLPVLFAIDRGGLVGPDGPTHAGSYDLTYLRCLPGMTIMAPADENEAGRMLATGFALDGPAAVRYPRGSGPGVPVDRSYKPIPIGKAELRRRGRDVVILAFGSMLTAALAAAELIDASVVNMRFVKPLDEDLIVEMAQAHRLVVTVEENVVAGGAGSGVNEVLAAQRLAVPILNLGLPDRPLEQASVAEMLTECGLDAAGLCRQIRAALAPGLVASRESA